jgi:hypothetical protein
VLVAFLTVEVFIIFSWVSRVETLGAFLSHILLRSANFFDHIENLCNFYIILPADLALMTLVKESLLRLRVKDF